MACDAVLLPRPQVEQVDEASGNAMAEVTVSVVEAILEPLGAALVAMKAKVEVRVHSARLAPVLPTHIELRM